MRSIALACIFASAGCADILGIEEKPELDANGAAGSDSVGGSGSAVGGQGGVVIGGTSGHAGGIAAGSAGAGSSAGLGGEGSNAGSVNDAGHAGVSGAAGHAGTANVGGSGGGAGLGGSGGNETAGAGGSLGGVGGASGSSAEGGSSGGVGGGVTGGVGGLAGAAGIAGVGGSSGSSGASGSAGNETGGAENGGGAGSQNAGGSSGMSGNAGSSGDAGSSGNAGSGGAAGAPVCNASALLEGFSASTLDSTKWTTDLTAPGAALTISTHAAQLTDGAMLVSIADFDPKIAPVRARGHFLVANPGNDDATKIYLRSDAVAGDASTGYAPANSIACAFTGPTSNTVTLTERTAGVVGKTSSMPFVSSVGDDVMLEAFDDGKTVTCMATDSTNIATATASITTTVAHANNRVAFGNTSDGSGDHTEWLENILIERGTAPGPTNAWSFEETAPQTFVLATPGVVVGSLDLGATRTDGFIGGGAHVEAKSFINFGYDPSQIHKSDFAVTLWLRAAEQDDVFTIVGINGNNSQSFWELTTTADNQISFDITDPKFGATAVMAPFPFDGAWHHIVAQRHSVTLSLYFDGLPVGTASTPTLIDVDGTTNGETRFGYNYGSDSLDCDVDELRIYMSRALSPCEISAIAAKP